jgi:hypothetical protein
MMTVCYLIGMVQWSMMWSYDGDNLTISLLVLALTFLYWGRFTVARIRREMNGRYMVYILGFLLGPVILCLAARFIPSFGEFITR